ALSVAMASFGAAGADPLVATGVPRRAFPSVTFELVSESEQALGDATALAVARGGEVVGDGPGVVLVDLPPRAWAAVAAVDGVELRRPMPVDVRPERAFAPEF